jgi:hypothetical protein
VDDFLTEEEKKKKERTANTKERQGQFILHDGCDLRIVGNATMDFQQVHAID